MGKRILIIDDDPDICVLLSMFLEKHGYKVVTAPTGNEGIARCRESNFDAIFCDYFLGDRNGLEVLNEIKKLDPWTVILIITGNTEVKTAVEMIKAGAFDYFTKPLLPDEILKTLDRAFSESLQPTDPHSGGSYLLLPDGNVVIANAASSKALYHRANLAANHDGNIILYGEGGTGKEVVARTIHHYSKSGSLPFIAVNCGAIGKEMPAAMLDPAFKNSFEETVMDKAGHFELANGGTLFLYGLADLSPDMQQELLLLLQTGKLGISAEQKDRRARIISASSVNLEDACEKGSFSRTLFNVLNDFSITLPALRVRKEDILPFANFFLEKINIETGKHIEGFEEEVVELFLHYEWPGNLRELRNVIRRAALILERGKINTDTLPAEILNSIFVAGRRIYHTEPLPEIFRLKRMKAEAEYNTIVDVLKKVNQNKTKAAEMLNVDRKTLYNKIKMYESNNKSA